MRYSIVLLSILLFFAGCFSDKKTPPKQEVTTEEVPKKELYPIELDEKQKRFIKRYNSILIN